jgi:hypothetical protein
MSQVTHADPFVQARARWLAAQSPQATAQARCKPTASSLQPAIAATLPADLAADLQALRAAGLSFAVSPEPPLPQPRPARTLTWADVSHLDVRDPRRTLYQYQLTYTAKGRPVPQSIVGNLRAAARDDLRRQRRSSRFASR